MKTKCILPENSVWGDGSRTGEIIFRCFFFFLRFMTWRSMMEWNEMEKKICLSLKQKIEICESRGRLCEYPVSQIRTNEMQDC